MVAGDTIPGSQTECGRAVTILDWSDRGSQLIKGVFPHHDKKAAYFTAAELNLYWVEDVENIPQKSSMRQRADAIKPFACKNLIAVLENPTDLVNIASVIRNVNALGVEKVYIVDPGRHIPDDWQVLRERRKLSKLSVSASKWTFVKRFNTTDECFDYLESMNFQSVVTSPHVKGKESIYLHEGDFTIMPKLAVWFGNEGKGISDRAVERSRMCVSIPMFGMVESLNLGTSSGIMLYEVTKQRRAYQSQYQKRGQRGARSDPLPIVMDTEHR